MEETVIVECETEREARREAPSLAAQGYAVTVDEADGAWVVTGVRSDGVDDNEYTETRLKTFYGPPGDPHAVPKRYTPRLPRNPD